MGWKHSIYISSHTTATINGQDVDIYSKPKKYFFNIQFMSGRADTLNGQMQLEDYGAMVSNLRKAIVDISFKDKIRERDIAYLDGVKPNERNDNYNYLIVSVREQNQRIAIYFQKINK